MLAPRGAPGGRGRAAGAASHRRARAQARCQRLARGRRGPHHRRPHRRRRARGRDQGPRGHPAGRSPRPLPPPRPDRPAHAPAPAPLQRGQVGRPGPEGAAGAADHPRCPRGSGHASGGLHDRPRPGHRGRWRCRRRDPRRRPPGDRPRAAVFASTRAIVATGCYGPAGFDPRWPVPKGAQEADGPDTIRKTVREQIAAGADWIKLYADYRRASGDPATPTFSLEELKAAADEAHSAGKPCAAHATTDEGIRRATLAGFDTIEHGYGASRETLLLMKERGTVLVPTMAAAEAIALYGGWRPESGKVPPGVAASRASVRLAHDLGITIAFGTDAGVFPHGQNARELELMVEAGLAPAGAGPAGARAPAPRLPPGSKTRGLPPHAPPGPGAGPPGPPPRAGSPSTGPLG